MPVLTVTREQFKTALQTVGVRQGDGLLVHSALQYLGKPEGGVAMYYEELAKQVGVDDSGNITVPAFTFAFARGEAFDRLKSPSQGMGVFSEYVRQHPQALRTPHPMQSIAVIGCHAVDLAGRDTPSAFDPGSAFEWLLDLDFKLLLLGASIQAVSIVHYSEQRARVPYRYWKDFTGDYRGHPSQAWQMRTYRMFVRDLDLDPKLDLSPIQRKLEDRHQWVAAKLNYGWISLCRLVDFVTAADDLLSEDPWILISNRP